MNRTNSRNMQKVSLPRLCQSAPRPDAELIKGGSFRNSADGQKPSNSFMEPIYTKKAHVWNLAPNKNETKRINSRNHARTAEAEILFNVRGVPRNTRDIIREAAISKGMTVEEWVTDMATSYDLFLKVSSIENNVSRELHEIQMTQAKIVDLLRESQNRLAALHNASPHLKVGGDDRCCRVLTEVNAFASGEPPR